jgi:hypothetical protein
LEQLADFGAWVWARHHNIASWYVRPLFVLPYCWFAYRRNRLGLAVTVLLFPTSLFWFPAPAQPSPEVERYLGLEQRVFLGSPWALAALGAAVAVFLVALATAFWRRSWVWGLAVLNAGTLVKVAWSVSAGGEAGRAAILPSLATLAVCNAAVLGAVYWRRSSRRRAGLGNGPPP